MPGKWIQKIHLKKGALRAAAQRAGAITPKGTIDVNWLKAIAKKGGKIGRRARLALLFRRFHH